jgi:signal peptidase I
MEIIDFNVEPNQGEASDSVQKKEEGAPQEKGEKFSWKNEVFSWLLTFAVAIAVALLLKNYVIINANVPTGSMENTIMPGDDLFGFRLSYLLSEPERGDIVIFKFPDDESQKFIKRIIGLPGEKVVIEDGKIYINDSEVPLEETYLKEEWVVATGPYEFNVPEDCYFVMGDNRNDSNDARFWDNTYVTSKEIIGKAEFVYYPFNHIKSLR